MCHLLAKATCMGIDFSLYLSLWSCEVLLLHWLQVRFCECEFRLCRALACQECKLNSCVPRHHQQKVKWLRLIHHQQTVVIPNIWAVILLPLWNHTFMGSVTVCCLLLLSFLICRKMRKTLTRVMYPCSSAQIAPSWLQLILLFVFQP